MENMCRVKWSLLVVITTIVGAFVFFCIDVSLLLGFTHSENVTLRAFLLVIINMTLLAFICNIPLYIKLTGESIIVKKVFGCEYVECEWGIAQCSQAGTDRPGL
jgi:hypothetical protein